MRFLFSLVIIIQLLAFNTGNALDLFDTGMWVEMEEIKYALK